MPTRPAEIPPPGPMPSRVADWPLPAYRFVPGLQPHPFRTPGGHQYTDGSAPVEALWDPETPWEQDRRYLRGLDLYDHRFYWEAHEALEALWHFAPKDSAVAPLLQGVIQGAAFALKRHMGQTQASERLLERALLHLSLAESRGGRLQRGLDLEEVRAGLRDFEAGGGWPTLSSGRARR